MRLFWGQVPIKAAYSSLLAWRIPWTEEHGVAKSWTRLSDLSFLSAEPVYTKRGPLHCLRKHVPRLKWVSFTSPQARTKWCKPG